ncbi:phosphotransferase family enzyme [Scopulibacillus darangshiensis]|uniref:Phosphotransferase family enzyme n=1 Tax=Scopulibacillus darangshiensis TaxID=442528 RepID=A0A4R2P346_9BACL|nr:aminoglycoside phosphotransferase family protein [Scopulibacillus darangshiensis]TCP29072.1 phosphotransferase family enzyme [Scopulibacillus darangshiensis]
MDHGFEAEVMKICSNKDSFVLKVWNKNSKPDIGFQYRLLKVLFERGLSAPKPLGWGINPNGDKVLLTTFDGTPVLKVNEKKMTEIATILSRIHHMHVKEIGKIQLPRYDFVDYFFPGVRENPDIFHALNALVQTTQIKQEHVIHGDFHLQNILEKDGGYTVIDWKNGQLGDPRYDFAWSLTLKKIYVSERLANVFRSAYLLDHAIQLRDLELFEALACLRWILLNRIGGVPKGHVTRDRVKVILSKNPFLNEPEFTI